MLVTITISNSLVLKTVSRQNNKYILCEYARFYKLGGKVINRLENQKYDFPFKFSYVFTGNLITTFYFYEFLFLNPYFTNHTAVKNAILLVYKVKL